MRIALQVGVLARPYNLVSVGVLMRIILVNDLGWLYKPEGRDETHVQRTRVMGRALCRSSALRTAK